MHNTQYAGAQPLCISDAGTFQSPILLQLTKIQAPVSNPNELIGSPCWTWGIVSLIFCCPLYLESRETISWKAMGSLLHYQLLHGERPVTKVPAAVSMTFPLLAQWKA